MKNIISIFSILLLTGSCKKQNNDPCIPEPISYKSLYSEYGCSLLPWEVNINYEKFVIVRDQVAYDSTLNGQCSANIDFNTYDLVIGRKQFATLQSIDYAVSRSCNDNSIAINANVESGLTAD